MIKYYYTLQDIFNNGNKTPFNYWVTTYDKCFGVEAQISYNNLTRDTTTSYLLDPLCNRWFNDRIALYVSDSEVDFSKVDNRDFALAPILKKLNTIIPTYKELYKRYNAMIAAMDSDDGLSNEATTTSINRHNDTPNANNDYSAEKYTSDISSNTTTSKQSNNKLDDYDIIKARIENLPLQIIKEMEEFELWI